MMKKATQPKRMSRRSFTRQFLLITINEVEVHHHEDLLIEGEEPRREEVSFDLTFVDAVEARIQEEDQVKLDSLFVEIIREVSRTVVGHLYEESRQSIRLVECHSLTEEDPLHEGTQI